MKCDKLKSLWVYCRDINENVDDEFLKFAPKNGYEELVEKSEVDEAIAELKAKLDRAIAERDGNQVCIDALKQKLESVQASMYADVVDANMENRRLRRALWIARANHADTMQNYNIECKCDGWVHRVDKWINVERKCLKKAEEYK
jgi:ribosomal protein L20